MIGLRESEFLDKSVALFISFIVLVIVVIFDEEVLRKLEFLAKSAFYQPGTLGEKVLEALFLYCLLGDLLRKILRLSAVLLLFRQALRTQFALRY